MRILVVEDEPGMLDLLRIGLREHGHTVMTAADGLDGLELAREHSFEVIILDVVLPKLNGFQVVRELRSSQNPAFVLMLTARDAEPDVILGLEAGADDYLTKPFSFAELLARVRAVSRAKPSALMNSLEIDTLIFDCDRRQAFRTGRCLNLTRTEVAILECLLRSPGEVVTRASLTESVWRENPGMGRGTLDSFINLLRKKVDLPSERKLVHTVKGVGYSVRLDPEPEISVRGRRL